MLNFYVNASSSIEINTEILIANIDSSLYPIFGSYSALCCNSTEGTHGSCWIRSGGNLYIKIPNNTHYYNGTLLWIAKQ